MVCLNLSMRVTAGLLLINLLRLIIVSAIWGREGFCRFVLTEGQKGQKGQKGYINGITRDYTDFYSHADDADLRRGYAC